MLACRKLGDLRQTGYYYLSIPSGSCYCAPMICVLVPEAPYQVWYDAQAAMRTHLEGCGFPYLCTDDVDLAIERLKDAGILRGGFQVQ